MITMILTKTEVIENLFSVASYIMDDAMCKHNA